MLEQIKQLQEEIAAFRGHDAATRAAFYHRFMHKKGALAVLFAQLKDVAPDQRKEIGRLLNALKQEAQAQYSRSSSSLSSLPAVADLEEDYTLPPPADLLGARHPITGMQKKIIAHFEKMGFSLVEGPDIVDDWHNFTALNFPPQHPARAMQDTFFIEKDPDWMLRTQTSSVQVRVMCMQSPPIRMLSPGKVFRNEAISARSHCMFHQIEGLYIHTHVSLADLKATLYHFVYSLFGQATAIRFRPSYFPFTTPSIEVDIGCKLCQQQGCTVCKKTGWVEVLGTGMVDPAVLTNCGIDPEQYTGFAFGMGVERMAMLYYQIQDIRLFTENDVRFLKQFVAEG